MKKIEFRPLKSNEIEARIAQVKPNGVTLLLYKDARCDMNILDEVVGCMNWKREHTRENANCIVSIWDEEKKQWISKEDTGTESYSEAQKGLASDSFKRACFNWGIGRELYTAPFIWISADKANIQNGKCFEKFEVSFVEYDDSKCISGLQIINAKTREVIYSFGKVGKPQFKTSAKSNQKSDNAKKIAVLNNLLAKAEKTEDEIFSGYSKKNNRQVTINNMNDDDFKAICDGLNKLIKIKESKSA